MKNLSTTKKVLLAVGVYVAGYYVWKMWKSHEISEQNKKIVASNVSEPETASTSVQGDY